MYKRFLGSLTFHVPTKLGELSQEWELETEWLFHNCKDHQVAQLQTLIKKKIRVVTFHFEPIA